MTPEEISNTLKELFGDSVETPAATSWQVETPKFRLLVLLSEDGTWLRILLPIGDAQEAQPFFDKLLEANFDTPSKLATPYIKTFCGEYFSTAGPHSPPRISRQPSPDCWVCKSEVCQTFSAV